MSRTNRDRLTFHEDWIGKVPKVWISHPHKNYTLARILKITGNAPWCDCCFPTRGNRKELFRSAKRKSERNWRRDLDFYN